MSDNISKIADPSTIGLTAYSIGLFCLAALVSGQVAAAGALALLIPLTLGVALLHFAAGTFGFIKGELFTALAFWGYGLFWFTFSFMQLGTVLKWFAPGNDIILAFYLIYTIFTVFIFIATLVTNTAVISVIGTLLAVFVLLDLSIYLGNAQLGIIAGYIGIVSALIAMYVVGGSILGAMYGRAVLPMGSAWSKPSNSASC